MCCIGVDVSCACDAKGLGTLFVYVLLGVNNNKITKRTPRWFGPHRKEDGVAKKFSTLANVVYHCDLETPYLGHVNGAKEIQKPPDSPAFVASLKVNPKIVESNEEKRDVYQACHA